MPTCCLLANLTGQLMIPAGRRHSAVRRHRRRHGTDTDFVCMIPTSAPHPVSDRRQLACDPNNCRGPRSGTPAPTFNNRSVLMSCFSSSDSTAFVISSYFYYSIQVAMPRWLNAHERALIVEMHEDEKVLDLQAHRRAEELQAAKEQLDASGLTQQQPPFEGRHQTGAFTTSACTTNAVYQPGETDVS
uniref:Uncharacterized protein n=1 Tax=Physcomitrium patens TaxID=3218 RepID=A0A2K1J388_PHYPA|nr:hypothetical protein PHYPA_021845 [Physcomitrium patens]